MAIASVTHVWSGDTWSDDLTGEQGYQSLYRVISDDPNESPQNVRTAAGIPSLGSAYPSDSAVYCRSRNARRLDNTRLVWEVTVDYERGENEPDEEPPDSPLDEPVKFRWTAGQYTKAIVKDRDGNAIVNSAGDYFDPPPEIEDVRWSVNIQANVSSVPAAILNYANAVNSNSFQVDGVSVQPNKAKIIGLDIGELQEKNDIPFRTLTIVIEFRREGYDLELLDQGFRINDAGTLKDILIEDEDGTQNRPSSPVLLNGSGERLSSPSPENAVYQTFAVHNELDFSVLPGIS